MPFLQNQTLKLVLTTPNELNDRSRKFDGRCLAINVRFTKNTGWYTNLGTEIVTPAFLETGSDTTNTTIKGVSQVVKKHTTANHWRAATGNPGAALRGWVAEASATKAPIHSHRPIHKDNPKDVRNGWKTSFS